MGIGQAIAFRLAEAGAGLMIADINPEAAGQTADQIKAKGGKAQTILADASSEEDAEMTVKAAVEAFGGVDILINNAGIFPHAPALEITKEMWDKVLDINLKGVYFNSRVTAGEMIKAGRGGKIVNIASMEGIHPWQDAAHYSTSKAGVIMITKTLALELAPHGILVNAVAPGGIATPGGVAVGPVLEAMGRSPGEIAEKFLARLPLARFGEPDDVAKVVLFLVSGAADYMTGSVVLADGGYQLT
jgi:2-deoxy-D-gluconate 3-dehydrogenase